MAHPHTPDAREVALEEARVRLVEVLVGWLDGAFSDGGHGEGLRAARDMLLRLDEPALRSLVYSMGIEGPEELTEPEPEERPRS
jgi:hypothetical protein